MFVGHYAAAFALKGKEKGASLGMLFIATQFVDILFFPFVLAGIENLKFVKGFTEVNDFNMDYYPYTHGLLGSVFWAALFFVLYFFVFSKNKINKKSIALVMALGVLSHWFTDLIVHSPDLPLISGNPKFGFGLWHSKVLTFGAEAVLLVLGLAYYLKKTKAVSTIGKYASLIFVIFLLLINYLNLFVLPANDEIKSLTISALFFYFLFALIAHFVDKKRT
ncbi:hypothetical protein MNBD_BACTEROID06-99 [hydrothermal vent metagenome]|uniref:Uncharacterized protein n=1 Tax=hydrothermal vent metagenome TaxID=652676 RepID=A0A3B0UM28_9ZZZZ